jgi:cytochrome P450
MLIEILLALLLLLLWAYYEVTKQFDYFKKKGVPFATPSFPFGSRNMKKMVLQEITFNEDISVLANNEFKDVKVFGFFAFGQPTWVINDEELTKRILIKDFEHFVDRRVLQEDFTTKANSIVSSFLTNLKGDRWKAMRTMMSGVFTSGRLKLMTPYVVKVGQQMEEHIGNLIASDSADAGILEMKSLFGMFTLDAIATTGFGIESNSFLEPDNKFRDMALTLIGAKQSWKTKLIMPKILFIMTFPRLASLFRMSFFPKQPVDFFTDIIERTYRHRVSTGERRNDIIDLVVDELNAAANKSKKQKKPDEEFESEFEKHAALDAAEVSSFGQDLDKEMLLVSNALLFFFAGFDTTSTGLSLIANALTIHQHVQERVAEEIATVLGDSEKISFEALQQLKYMDMVISEVFRYCV